MAKVNELMALCDRLEESMETARKESAALLEGVLHGVFAERETHYRIEMRSSTVSKAAMKPPGGDRRFPNGSPLARG